MIILSVECVCRTQLTSVQDNKNLKQIIKHRILSKANENGITVHNSQYSHLQYTWPIM